MGGSVGLLGDQVYRGISRTGAHAALVGEVGWMTDTGWSASLELTWARVAAPAHVAFVAATIGRGWQLDADWAMRLGYAHYGYPAASERTFGFDEFTAGIEWQGECFATLGVSPNSPYADSNGPVRHDPAATLEVGARERLIGRLTFDAGLGIVRRAGAGYAYGSFGLSSGLGPVQLSLSVIDSNAASNHFAPRSLAGRRWVASVFVTF